MGDVGMNYVDEQKQEAKKPTQPPPYSQPNIYTTAAQPATSSSAATAATSSPADAMSTQPFVKKPDDEFKHSQNYYPNMQITNPILYSKGSNPLTYRDMVALEIMDTIHDFEPGVELPITTHKKYRNDRFIDGQIKGILQNPSILYLPDYVNEQDQTIGPQIGCDWKENDQRAWAFIRGCNPPHYEVGLTPTKERSFEKFIENKYANTWLGEKLCTGSLLGEDEKKCTITISADPDTNTITPSRDPADLDRVRFHFMEGELDKFLKESATRVDRKNALSLFLANYLKRGEGADKDLYFTHDSTGGNTVPDMFVCNSEKMHTLITPQNLYDSATNAGEHFISNSSEYYFPQTHEYGPQGDVIKAFVSRRNVYTGKMYKCIYSDNEFHLSPKQLLPGAITAAKIMESKKANITTAYSKFRYNIYQKPGQFPNQQGGTENVEEANYQINPKTNGPSIGYLQGLINTFQEHREKTDDKIVEKLKLVKPDKSTVTPFMQGMPVDKRMYDLFIKRMKMNQNGFFLDAKRCGDQDQVDAAYIASMDPQHQGNVVFVTGDVLCALYARLYTSLHTIYVHKISDGHMMDIFRGAELSPTQLTDKQKEAKGLLKRIIMTKLYYDKVVSLFSEPSILSIIKDYIINPLVRVTDTTNPFNEILQENNGEYWKINVDPNDDVKKAKGIKYYDLLAFYSKIYNNLADIRIRLYPDPPVENEYTAAHTYLNGKANLNMNDLKEELENGTTTRDEINAHIKTIEELYEFLPSVSMALDVDQVNPSILSMLQNKMRKLTISPESLAGLTAKQKAAKTKEIKDMPDKMLEYGATTFYHYTKTHLNTIVNLNRLLYDELEQDGYEYVQPEKRSAGSGSVFKKAKTILSTKLEKKKVTLGKVKKHYEDCKSFINKYITSFKNKENYNKFTSKVDGVSHTIEERLDQMRDILIKESSLSSSSSSSSSNDTTEGDTVDSIPFDDAKKEIIDNIESMEEELKNDDNSFKKAYKSGIETINDKIIDPINEVITYNNSILEEVFNQLTGIVNTISSTLFTNPIPPIEDINIMQVFLPQQDSSVAALPSAAALPATSSQQGGVIENNIVMSPTLVTSIHMIQQNGIDTIGSHLVHFLCGLFAEDKRPEVEDMVVQFIDHYSKDNNASFPLQIDEKILFDILTELYTQRDLVYYGNNYMNVVFEDEANRKSNYDLPDRDQGEEGEEEEEEEEEEYDLESDPERLDGYLLSLLFSSKKSDKIAACIIFPILFILSTKESIGSSPLNLRSSFVRDLLHSYFPDQLQYKPNRSLDSSTFSWNDRLRWMKAVQHAIHEKVERDVGEKRDIGEKKEMKMKPRAVNTKMNTKMNTMKKEREILSERLPLEHTGIIGGSRHKKTRKQNKMKQQQMKKKQQKVKSFKAKCKKASRFLKKTRSRK